MPLSFVKAPVITWKHRVTLWPHVFKLVAMSLLPVHKLNGLPLPMNRPTPPIYMVQIHVLLVCVHTAYCKLPSATQCFITPVHWVALHQSWPTDSQSNDVQSFQLHPQADLLPYSFRSVFLYEIIMRLWKFWHTHKIEDNSPLWTGSCTATCALLSLAARNTHTTAGHRPTKKIIIRQRSAKCLNGMKKTFFVQ